MRGLLDRYGPAARAWTAFLVAPHAGSVLTSSLTRALGVDDLVVVSASTTLGTLLATVGFVIGGVLGSAALLRPRGPALLYDADGDGSRYWFPGRLLGGIALVAAPLLLVAGELARIRFYFYYPYQLRAFDAHPQLMTVSYGLYAFGLLLLWPAFLTLTRLIGTRLPGWATWGGALAITGLFIRLFHEGVNYLSFQAVDHVGVATTLAFVEASYQHWYVFYPLVFTDNLAWVVLAIGAYRARRLGWLPALGVVALAAHSSGVLKGSDLALVFQDLALCAAFIPLGVALLRRTSLSRRAKIAGMLTVATLLVIYGYTAWNLAR